MKQPSSITLQVHIKNGRFGSNQPAVVNILKAFEGKTIDITFTKRKVIRSNNQNSYYWGSIVPLWQNLIKVEWGELWGIAAVHEFLKERCNYREKVFEDTGEVIRLPKSTKENSTAEQEVFHSRCRELAMEFFNTEIPLPEKKIKMEF